MGAGLGDTASPGRDGGGTAGNRGRGVEAGTGGDHGGGGAQPRARWSLAAFAILVAGLAAGTVLRLLLLPSEGLKGDLEVFARWTHLLATDAPLGRIYEHEFAFGPVMAYVFWAVGHLQPAFQAIADPSDPTVRAWLKVPAVLSDVAIAAVVAFALKERPRVAVASGLAVALVPVTWYVSAFWGQYESIYTLFGLLSAVLALRGRWVLAAVMLGLALGTKPQALTFVVPLAAFAVARLGWRGAMAPAAATAAALVVLWLPFLPAGGPTAYLGSTSAYQGDTFAVLSLRAWNPWWILQSAAGGEGVFLADGGRLLGPLTPRLVGYAASALGLLLVFVALRRGASDRALWLGLGAAVLIPYCLLTAMHERYAYPAVVFLALLLADRRILVAWLVLVVAVTADLVAAAPPGGVPGSLVPLWGAVGLAGSAAIAGVTVYVTAVLVREAPGKRASPRAVVQVPPGSSG